MLAHHVRKMKEHRGFKNKKKLIGIEDLPSM
jgi:hypothetical protein